MQVYAFGSVPLKTYLPDGDVDVTILTNTPEDSAFIDDVYRLLSSEANNDDAQFTVKKLEIIHAKVHFLWYTSATFFW
jgi:DNA polymerase sigma